MMDIGTLAQARRFYHHVINGGQLKPEDVSYMVSALEEAYDNIASNADARLIAAAPDLLEALENLLKVYEGEGGTQYHAGDIARAAIAKAKGE